MEESTSSTVWDGKITGISIRLASHQEICTSSNSDFPISHASQLGNPFLGLPLECGKCESCGAVEPGKCEGHFGYIELPIPIYHPSHVSELKRLLSLLCLKCLKMKNRKIQTKNIGILERVLSSCCEETSQISVNEVKTTDGACYLELKLPSRSRFRVGFWNFMEKYGYRYGESFCRPLLPSEAMVILKKLPAETKKKLAAKGYFPQDGYILQYLPVPPNCLSVPDISDGITVMSSDLSIVMLKKVLKQVEIIKSSRSGMPNFESHEVEANDLQAAVAQYFQVRGTSKASRDMDTRFGVKREANESSTKAWLEKMKTLFIRKGCGFSSRSVITGDAYKGVHEIGLPFEIAQRITFEERVTQYNLEYLQKLVDEKLCLTYRDGFSTYSLREGSKGHTFLRIGQVVHRRVMDGDVVFINRPPTTHKHSLQALSVYVHDDHTVKINPLICGPLSADFDGDCVHLFYPQSLPAKAEVLELFSVAKQLSSSHSGNLNLQLATDSLLSLKRLFRKLFISKTVAQQLAMFLPNYLPLPAVLKAHRTGPHWTSLQLLQMALPHCFNSSEERHLIHDSDILIFDSDRDIMQSVMNDIVTLIFTEKGPEEVLRFFNFLQPLLMENLFSEGFSVGLEDFSVSRAVTDNIQNQIQDISQLLYQLRLNYNELVELQVENHLRLLKVPVAHFILKSSIGDVIDSKSDSAISKVVQQVGFLGLQLSDKGKFYSKNLVGDMASLFRNKYPYRSSYPSEEFGMVRSCLFQGLDPYQEMVHSISAREVIVRSSRGLTEPGTLFKNLMAILRDVVVCYDGTVRNTSSNSIIQFEYGVKPGTKSLFAAGEPVGVLAATAMSNPAYKAVLDSSPSSNSSWEMMKEILLCAVNFRNDLSDRRVILYLNTCDCGRKHCQENAAYCVKNQLKKVSLKDIAARFLIEYSGQSTVQGSSELEPNLVGHVHLNDILFQDLNMSIQEVCEKCEDTIDSFRKKKKVGHLFKRIKLSSSEICSFGQSCGTNAPCLKFFWQDISEHHLEKTSHFLADTICPVLLDTIVKGDLRICKANIIWICPDTTTWIRNPSKKETGELALDVIVEKQAVKQSGDAWRVVLDSCLPVIHLIDTTRSIPHAIKQVQQLLGISCAFEQAVQRLSTSVSMVTKGLLKEHLILLANSMTCSGNLIGFNSGGIKAMFRSLNVQVPFTEATLFTPKKCFERAAEKCHVDSLSSIVASCSWGKHVAVGTGSRFDLLWDTTKVGMNQRDGIDVYNFLHLVRSGTRGEEMASACLGADVDYLDLESDDKEWGMSPDHGSDKLTFEDGFEPDLDNWMVDGARSGESNWEKVSTPSTPNGGEWVVDKQKNRSSEDMGLKTSGWSGWGADAVQKDDMHSSRTQDVEQVTQAKSSDAWGASSAWGVQASSNKEVQHDSPRMSWKSNQDDDSTCVKEWASDKKQNWGKGKASSKPRSWSTSDNNNTSHNVPPTMTQDTEQATELKASHGWGCLQSESEKEESPLDRWNSRETEESFGGKDWQTAKPLSKRGNWSSSGKNLSATADVPSNMTQYTEYAGAQSKTSHGWGSLQSESGKKELPLDSWSSRQNDERSDGKSWHTVQAVSKPNSWSGWGKEKSTTDNVPSTMAQGREWAAKSKPFCGWGSLQSESGKKESTPDAWTSRKSDKSTDGKEWLSEKKQNLDDVTTESKPGGWPSWGTNTMQTEDSSSRRPEDAEPESHHKASPAWGSSDKTPNMEYQYGQLTKSPANVWSPCQNELNEQSSQPESTSGWDSASTEMCNENVQPQWGPSRRYSGKREQSERPRGWGSSNTGEWRNRPMTNLTATRQRLDMFTTEEQDILLDVEPIMQSIRRIMHQTGYNDGDPFSADDQSYILDNVFNHHPDKASKMGAGIEYIMVSKHSSFLESRCFYIVSTDGHREDFSYRKCLENFIKGKYPELAEAFIGKYFRKPRSSGNRERSVAPEEPGHRERSVALEESGPENRQ
ncbi:DNA-directed RNA polymerase [Bertholletia excelsa]